jgi:hypothetical protein
MPVLSSGNVCHTCAAFSVLGGIMARKTGQIIRRGSRTWLVRIYVGRTPETRRRRYIGKFIHGGLRSAQAHLNRMLAERDLGRNIRSSRQTVGQYLDHWLDICARPRLRPKSFRDYSSLLARLRPTASGFATVWGAFASGNSEALQRVAEPEALATHHLLYPCGSLLGLQTGGPLETPPNEPGRGRPSTSATTSAFHRVRCRPGEAVHRSDVRT